MLFISIEQNIKTRFSFFVKNEKEKECFLKKNHFNYKHNLYLIDVLSPHIYFHIIFISFYFHIETKYLHGVFHFQFSI